jgi:5'-3' exonuclease
MATLATRDHDSVEIVSGDRDMIALASARVRVLYTGKGLAKMEDLGPDEVRAKYGIAAENYADFAILRGDPSDGLPGVAGVGEKTAAALVARFGTVEAIVAAAEARADGFPAGSTAKILAACDYLAVAPGAVRIRLDVPIDEVDDALPSEPRNIDMLTRLATDLGIESSIGRVRAAIAAATG